MIIESPTQAIADPFVNGDVILDQDVDNFTMEADKMYVYPQINGTKGVAYVQPSPPEITIKGRKVKFFPEAGIILLQAPTISLRGKEMSDEIDIIYNECSTTNWDGYGARPVYKYLRKTVEKFLNALPDRIPNPEIVPDPDGEISLDWYTDRTKVFSISLGKNGRLAYAFSDGERKSSGIEIFGEEIPKSLISQLDSFLA